MATDRGNDRLTLELLSTLTWQSKRIQMQEQAKLKGILISFGHKVSLLQEGKEAIKK